MRLAERKELDLELDPFAKQKKEIVAERTAKMVKDLSNAIARNASAPGDPNAK